VKNYIILLGILVATSASAGGSIVNWPGYTGNNPIFHIQSSPLGVYDAFMQDQWTEWRREAAEFAEKVAKDESIAKKVGKKMEYADVRCLAWIHLTNKIITWTRGMEFRFEAMEKPLPEWISEGKKKAERRRDSHCGPWTGPDGGTNENLGPKYAAAMWEGEADDGKLKKQVSRELIMAARAVSAMKDMATTTIQILRALPTSGNLIIIIDPKEVMPDEDRKDYQL
jgi:hypothetical protein